MSAPISVVIPTLDAVAELPATVEALLEGVTSGLVRELVLSDGGSSDGIAGVARELGAVLVEGPAGRGGQIARGVAAAAGDWLLILLAGTHLAPGWAEAAHAHMTAYPDRAGWFRLRLRAPGLAPRIVERVVHLRALLGLPCGDQGLLIPRALLDAAGGIPGIPPMEEAALARRLRGRLRPIPAVALTSAARYLRDGWTLRCLFNLGTLLRCALGTPPERPARRYDAGE